MIVMEQTYQLEVDGRELKRQRQSLLRLLWLMHGDIKDRDCQRELLELRRDPFCKTDLEGVSNLLGAIAQQSYCEHGNPCLLTEQGDKHL